MLKFSNAHEHRGILEMQNSIMNHLTMKLISSPPVIKSIDGDNIVECNNKAGQKIMVRVLQWLEGDVIAHVERCEELYSSLGAFVGEMDIALTDFHHPEAHRTMSWDLANCKGAIIGAFHAVIIEEKRKIITHFLELYDKIVTPNEKYLRKSVIHNDANDWNILGNIETKRCTGVIDFGDTVYTHTVNNISIAIAYAMLKQEEPLQVAASILHTYTDIYPLSRIELNVVFILSCMRLCVSGVLGAQAISLAPENEYLLLHR